MTRVTIDVTPSPTTTGHVLVTVRNGAGKELMRTHDCGPVAWESVANLLANVITSGTAPQPSSAEQ